MPSDETASGIESITISGKTVEEVGFEKVQRQLAVLPELKIVILDGMCIKAITGLSPSPEGTQPWNKQRAWLGTLKMRELDLSRNLIESWADVLRINNALPHLRTLRLAYDLLLRCSMFSH